MNTELNAMIAALQQAKEPNLLVTKVAYRDRDSYPAVRVVARDRYQMLNAEVALPLKRKWRDDVKNSAGNWGASCPGCDAAALNEVLSQLQAAIPGLTVQNNVPHMVF